MTKLERSILIAWGVFGLFAVVGLVSRRAVILEWLPALALVVFVLIGLWLLRFVFGKKEASKKEGTDSDGK